jgi:hypothetical protein
LEAGEGPEFNRFHNLYSLIPRFQPSTFPPTGRYDIYCNLLPIQIIDENGKFTAVEAGRILETDVAFGFSTFKTPVGEERSHREWVFDQG